MKMFDEEFKQTEKKIKRTFWKIFIINGIVTLGLLGAIGWFVHVLLKHFGIVG